MSSMGAGSRPGGASETVCELLLHRNEESPRYRRLSHPLFDPAISPNEQNLTHHCQGRD
jgi:hypothetical protein